MRWPAWALLVVACTAPATAEWSAGPPDGEAPLIDADDPEPMPDDPEPVSFILPPESSETTPGGSFVVAPSDPDRPSDEECDAARRSSRYFCGSRETVRPFDASSGDTLLDCPSFIRGRGPRGDLEGTEGFPACAMGTVEPCETHARRRRSGSDLCCYAWTCPTHARSTEPREHVP